MSILPYEVSRSLAACEGALLMVDAAQGVEAQTVANVHLAHEAGPDDRPGHQQNRSAERGCPDCEEAAGRDSRDSGRGSDSGERKDWDWHRGNLEAIVHRIPPPQQLEDEKLRALVFDSVFDIYRGVVALRARLFRELWRPVTAVKLMSTDRRATRSRRSASSPRSRLRSQN